MERVQDSEVKNTANFQDEMRIGKRRLLQNEVIAKIPGNAPGFLRFWDVAERVEVWYNRGRKD